MNSMEKILQLHEQNLQMYLLIESAITCLENKVFETMMNFSCLTGGVPPQLIFELHMQRRIIEVTIGDLQYYVEIEAVMNRLKTYTSIGIEEMTGAISDELVNSDENYFTLDT